MQKRNKVKKILIFKIFLNFFFFESEMLESVTSF